jgi:alpha-glucosidase
MKTKLIILLLLVFSIAFFNCAQTSQEINVKSPDEKVNVVFSLQDGVAHYSILYHDVILVKPSKLGFLLKDGAPLDTNFSIKKVSRTTFDEIWEPVWGETDKVRNHYNQVTIELEENNQAARKMHLVFRVYNDGVGFRYILPEQPNLKKIEIMSEETQFCFTDNHIAWWIPDDYDSYEHLYRKTLLSEIEGANTPITVKTVDGLYLSIHEADLTDFSDMTLKPVPGKNYTFKSELVPWPDGIKVKASIPHKTPWRTIQIATKPGDLIESHLIVNLNEPCILDDVSWIKPMKYMGIWWGMHIGKYTWYSGPKHGATTENAKRYIDFASEHNIPALLIEGWNLGWEYWLKGYAFNFLKPYDDFDLEEVVRYGREKGVHIIGHHETGGDIPTYEEQIDSAFSLYEKLGIPAVKTGYAGTILPEGQHHHGQWMVNHYRMVVKKAAEHHLMLDVHEPIKPTGIRRTYPNMMTREGVRGMEFNAWSNGNPPEHTTILPFTRMLAGPLDYTPGIFDLTFDEYRKENRVYTTLAKQLALYIVLYSPLQMAADLPENYDDYPVFKFIENVPTDWNETKVLNGEIGDYVTIARRNGENWYIGSITDENKREFELPLFFLEPERKYLANIYADDPDADWQNNPSAIVMQNLTITSRDTLSLVLAPGGGQAIEIKPVREK